MRGPSTSNLKNFTVSLALTALTLGVFIPSGNANAGALKGLADANNAVYRDIRDLGRAATPGRIVEIQQKHFGPAMSALNAEHYSKYLDWKKAIKANATETKEEIARILGKKYDPSKAGEKSAKGEGAAEPAKAVGRVSSGPAEQGGEGGAVEAKFGGKREEKKVPVNEDGIIMNQ